MLVGNLDNKGFVIEFDFSDAVPEQRWIYLIKYNKLKSSHLLQNCAQTEYKYRTIGSK